MTGQHAKDHDVSLAQKYKKTIKKTKKLKGKTGLLCELFVVFGYPIKKIQNKKGQTKCASGEMKRTPVLRAIVSVRIF